jgi:hypothetical protein
LITYVRGNRRLTRTGSRNMASRDADASCSF